MKSESAPPTLRLAVCALAVTPQRFAGTGQTVPLWYKSAKCPLQDNQTIPPSASVQKSSERICLFVLFFYIKLLAIQCLYNGNTWRRDDGRYFLMFTPSLGGLEVFTCFFVSFTLQNLKTTNLKSSLQTPRCFILTPV